MTNSLPIDFDVQSPQQAKELLTRDAGACLIDVREPFEFRAVHAKGAKNIPLGEVGTSDIPSGKLVILCKSGGRAGKAAQQLQAMGRACVVVEGGTDAWVSAGLEHEVGKKAMSLERQVRIAAGLLVVSGIVFGLLVHPAFIGLSAFVGCGLVFAGITDWCGMGMLLAKMPWNK
jgi:rhodanese-related sulfurtransferase